MRHLPVFLVLIAVLAGSRADAALQIAWEAPTDKAPRVLKNFTLEELAARTLATLNEKDPFAKDPQVTSKFQGLSLALLIEEATKTFTASDRSLTDLCV